MKFMVIECFRNHDAYQRLLDSAARADVFEAIRQGVEDIVNGKTRPARKVFADMRRRDRFPLVQRT